MFCKCFGVEQIKSIERIIATLEQTIAEGAGQGDEGIRMEIAMLRNERAQLCAGFLGDTWFPWRLCVSAANLNCTQNSIPSFWAEEASNILMWAFLCTLCLGKSQLVYVYYSPLWPSFSRQFPNLSESLSFSLLCEGLQAWNFMSMKQICRVYVFPHPFKQCDFKSK